MQHSTTHSNTLQHTTPRYSSLKHPAPHYTTFHRVSPCCTILQHTAIATHCNILQHTAIYCNTLQHTATHCNILQHTATHYNTLHHATPCWNTLHQTTPHCTALHHVAPYCNALPLQHTTTYRNTGCAPAGASIRQQSRSFSFWGSLSRIWCGRHDSLMRDMIHWCRDGTWLVDVVGHDSVMSWGDMTHWYSWTWLIDVVGHTQSSRGTCLLDARAHDSLIHEWKRSDLEQLRLPKYPTSFHGSPHTYHTRFHGSPQNFKQVWIWVNGVPVPENIYQENWWSGDPHIWSVISSVSGMGWLRLVGSLKWCKRALQKRRYSAKDGMSRSRHALRVEVCAPSGGHMNH